MSAGVSAALAPGATTMVFSPREGDAGGRVRVADAREIDALALERRAERGAVSVGADGADHGDRSAEACRGDGLVGALPAG